jgi:hypothetical protein
MMPILHHLWPSLALAGLLGIVFGWISRSAGPMNRAGRIAAILAAICLVVAGAVALLGLVPERAGFWLDSAVLHALAYVAGLCLGWGACRLARQTSPAATGSAP